MSQKDVKENKDINEIEAQNSSNQEKKDTNKKRKKHSLIIKDNQFLKEESSSYKISNQSVHIFSNLKKYLKKKDNTVPKEELNEMEIEEHPELENTLELPATKEESSSLKAIPLEKLIAEEKPNGESEKKLESSTQAEMKVEDNPQKSDTIDYFQFDFGTPKAGEPKVEEPIKTVKKENWTSFAFYDVMRPVDTGAQILPEGEDKIEIKKLLEQKDNSEEEKETAFVVRENNKNSLQRDRKILKFSLYLFYLFLILFAILFIFMLIQRGSDFSLPREEITLALQSTYQVEIIQNKKVAENQNFEWMSSDEKVVTVDESGNITAIGRGSSTITVKSKKTQKEKSMVVTAIDILIQSLRFEKEKITISVGEEKTIFPIINEDPTILANLDWASTNESIVEVDQQGHIKGLQAGKSTILVEAPNENIRAEITVEVKDNKESSSKPSNKPSNSNTSSNSHTNSNSQSNSNVSVTGVTLDMTSVTLKVGEKKKVTATVKPQNAKNKSVSWSSSNPSIATVENGVITAIKEGKCTITVETKDGKKRASVAVTVEKGAENEISVTSIALNKEQLSLEVGATSTLQAIIKPENATNKKVIWSSNNVGIAKVENGVVTAVKAGTAIITVTTSDGKLKATCTVTVKEKEPTSFLEVMKKKSKGTNVDFAKQSTASDSGVYQLKGSNIYFYRGNVLDNYVLFAGYCWQIVRTTETQGTKLVYVSSGNKCTYNKKSVLLTSASKPDKTKYADSTSTYLYKNSNIKSKVESWYNNGIGKSSSASKVESTKWCNDIISDSAAQGRTPTLKCATEANAVTSKVGIITLDEMIITGGVFNKNATHRSNYFLYIPQNYPLSDGRFSDGGSELDNITMVSMTIAKAGGGNSSYVHYLGSNGQIESYIVTASYSIRPMIVLSKDTQFSSGKGTISNPYVVK